MSGTVILCWYPLELLTIDRNGPSESFVTGSLKNFSVIDRLHLIDVPTLLINGAYDECVDACIEPMFKGINKVRWITFDEASHLSYIEQREKYMEKVGSFLGA